MKELLSSKKQVGVFFFSVSGRVDVTINTIIIPSKRDLVVLLKTNYIVVVKIYILFIKKLSFENLNKKCFLPVGWEY